MGQWVPNEWQRRQWRKQLEASIAGRQRVQERQVRTQSRAHREKIKLSRLANRAKHIKTMIDLAVLREQQGFEAAADDVEREIGKVVAAAAHFARLRVQADGKPIDDTTEILGVVRANLADVMRRYLAVIEECRREGERLCGEREEAVRVLEQAIERAIPAVMRP